MTEPRAWLYEHPEGHLNVSVSRDAHGTWEGWLERPLYGPEAADRIIALEAEIEKLKSIVQGWHYLAVGPDEMGDYYTQKQLIKASEPYASPALATLEARNG